MNAAVEQPPLLLDRRQAARVMSISVRLLDSCTKAKEVPHVRIARRVLNDPQDLSAWIEARKNRSP